MSRRAVSAGNDNGRLFVVAALMITLVSATAVACIYSKHQSRKLFVELQALNTERDELEVNWGRLQIEQSTWSTHSRVERLARGQMKMRTPQPNDIRLVRP